MGCALRRPGAIFQFRKILLASLCLVVAMCLHAPVALAQHGGGRHGGFGGGHFGGGHSSGYSGGHSGGGHASAPHGSSAAQTGVGSYSSSGIFVRPVRFNSTSFVFRPKAPVPFPHPPQPAPIFFAPVFFNAPFFFCGGFNSFGWPACGPFWGPGCGYSPFYRYGYGYWGYGYGGFPYNGYGFGSLGLGMGGSVYYPTAGEESATAPSYMSPSYPTDVRARDLVELFFKDGTVFEVTDYWLVDGQLHFLTVDARGEKAVEHVLPFDSLDLQNTVDVNTGRGFRFQLRSESMEQYFRNHPEEVPKVDPEKEKNP